MADPFFGYTSTVSINDGSAQAFVALTNPAKVEMPERTAKLKMFTTLTQANRAEQVLPLMINSGKLTIEQFNNATDLARWVALLGIKYITGSTAVQVKVTQADGTVYTCSGCVESIKPGSLDNDDLISSTIVFAISGLITIS